MKADDTAEAAELDLLESVATRLTANWQPLPYATA